MYPITRSVVFSFIFLFCLLTDQPTDGQIPTRKANLYEVALFTSLSQMEKSWGQIDDSDAGKIIRTDYRHTIVDKIPEITNGLPTQQGDYRVEYLDSAEQMERYKKLRKGFAVLRILPMENDDSILSIHISVSYLTYDKHKFKYGISDWSDVGFQFDCENQRFVISSLKLGGI